MLTCFSACASVGLRALVEIQLCSSCPTGAPPSLNFLSPPVIQVGIFSKTEKPGQKVSALLTQGLQGPNWLLEANSEDNRVEARVGKAHFNVANLNGRLEDFTCKEVAGQNGSWRTRGRMQSH